MKKKTLVLIAISLVMVVVIYLIAQNFPPANENEASGTIGKVDKYRKVQMTEKDVILRSEFISDTSTLAKSIQGLLYFNAFIKEYAADIQTCSDYLSKNEPSVAQLKSMTEYSSFLNNNLSTLENTIGLLTDFYSGDTTDMSVDVEKKIIDFDNFVTQLAAKDSVISVVLSGLENKIEVALAAKGKKDEEINKIKNIHDQMLIKNFQSALMMGVSPAGLNVIFNRPLYNKQNLGLFCSNKLNIIGVTLKSEELKVFLNNDKLGFLNKEKLGVLNKEKLGGIELTNSEKFGVIFNKEKLGPFIRNIDKLGGVSALNKEKLGPLLSSEKLGPGVWYAKLNAGIGNLVLGNKLNNSQQLQQFLNAQLNSNLQSRLLSSGLMNNATGSIIHH